MNTALAAKYIDPTYVFDVLRTQDGYRVTRTRNGCMAILNGVFPEPEDAAWFAQEMVETYTGSQACATLGHKADDMLQAAFYTDEPGYAEAREFPR